MHTYKTHTLRALILNKAHMLQATESNTLLTVR